MLGKILSALAAMAVLVGSRGAGAVGLPFDFKDPKEINAVALTLDSPLEPIVGYAKGISGTVLFDPANPRATTGRIAVDVSTVQFANDGYTATARGPAGLNGERYPQILLTVRRVVRVAKASSNLYRATVLADFTCHGITTPLRIPVTARYIPGLAEERTNGNYRGDLLVLHTQFKVSRTRQGITAGIPISMVGDDIEVRVAVVGIHYARDQKPATKSKKAAAVPPLRAIADRWQLEFEDRDDPLKVDAAFDLSGPQPGATFRTADGDLKPEQIRFDGSHLTFHLPDNPIAGAADAQATLENGAMHGEILTRKGPVRFHGRPSSAATPPLTGRAAPPQQGPGFRDLKMGGAGTDGSLPDRMRFYRVPGITLARIQGFEVVEQGVYGVTSAETGEPVDESTLFQAGGMGAPLVDIAVLRLAAQGTIDLNRPANDYLKSWKIPESALTAAHRITVADLLRGTSGLTQNKFTGYPPGVPRPTLAALLNGADPHEMEPVKVRSEPGSRPISAGINRALLELLLTDVTGLPFDDLMRKWVFLPLGMAHSSYRPEPDANGACRIAPGHYASGDLTLDRYHVYPEQGESGLWTTAADFARALCQVLRMLNGRPNAILGADHLDLLRSVASDTMVLGLMRDRDGSLYRGGDSYGYYAELNVNSERGYGVVVMQNRMASWKLYNEIVKAVGQRNGWSR